MDNHFGGMGGGHYTAFCRNKEDGVWYNYDDSRVSMANVEAVQVSLKRIGMIELIICQSRAAYLLFYRRRTSRPIGGISRIKAEVSLEKPRLKSFADLAQEASRAASPMPHSPTAGPLTPPTLAASSSASSSSFGSKRASYSPSSPGPSPVLSAAPDSDSDLVDTIIRSRNLRNLGAGIGFGNNAWEAASSAMPGSMPAVRHSFGNNTPPDTSSDPGSSTLRGIGIPSPPESEDGFERIRAQSRGGGADVSWSGQVIRSNSGRSEDAEMVGKTRSPD